MYEAKRKSPWHLAGVVKYTGSVINDTHHGSVCNVLRSLDYYVVMLCYVMLCSFLLYYIILCCVVLCCVVLYCIILHYIILQSLHYIIIYYL